uniref:KIB1-4 beta-propeller domain-containing protein n=1 Tax=Aegilops tauschii TaxID=37682 RepID=M8BUN8_AEGTA
MAPAPWSDLHGELLVSIADTDGVSLRDYASLRGKVQLGSPPGGKASVCKIVFSSNTNPNDNWRAVALYDHNRRVAYIDTGGGRIIEDKEWTTVDVADGSCYDDMAFHAGDDNVYFLSSCGSVHVLHMPRGGQLAVIEPLANLMHDPNPAAAYAAPYHVVSPNMVTKHMFLCHGSLYQVWKNTNANVNLGSGYFRMSAGEIFVLRYDPGRWPCWDVVKDLGGCSVFLGKSSSPAVVRPAVPEVRVDCVYWIDWQGVPMVCDIATGTSKPWVLPCGAGKGDCWYFGHDDMTSIDTTTSFLPLARPCQRAQERLFIAKHISSILLVLALEQLTWVRVAQQVYDVPFDDAKATPSTLPGVMVPPMSGFAQQAEKEELGMAETSMAAAPALLFQALLPVLPVRSPVAVRGLLA